MTMKNDELAQGQQIDNQSERQLPLDDELSLTDCVFGLEEVKMPKPDDIISEVCCYYLVSVDDFYGPSKRHVVTTARRVAAYLIRTMTNQSLRGIGKIINRHPLTVDRAIQKIETRIKNDGALSKEIRDISVNINLHGAKEYEQFMPNRRLISCRIEDFS